jgi:hypothetical protein
MSMHQRIVDTYGTFLTDLLVSDRQDWGPKRRHSEDTDHPKMDKKPAGVAEHTVKHCVNNVLSEVAL